MISNTFNVCSSSLNSITRKMSSISWKFGLLVVIVAIIGCQSQTFQYSRGWTNGKRSGNSYTANQQPASPVRTAALPAQADGRLMYDDGPIVGIPLQDDSSIPILSGAFPLFATTSNKADGKARVLDYSKLLTRKLGNGNNPNRKPPMWVVDVEQGASSSNGNSNNNGEDF